MNKHLSTLERINDLIRRKATGTPRQLADKLGISKRMVHYYIQNLREEFGLEIDYDKNCQSYTYHGDTSYTFMLHLGNK